MSTERIPEITVKTIAGKHVIVDELGIRYGSFPRKDDAEGIAQDWREYYAGHLT